MISIRYRISTGTLFFTTNNIFHTRKRKGERCWWSARKGVERAWGVFTDCVWMWSYLDSSVTPLPVVSPVDVDPRLHKRPAWGATSHDPGCTKKKHCSRGVYRAERWPMSLTVHRFTKARHPGGIDVDSDGRFVDTVHAS